MVKPGDPDHFELPYARVLPVAFAFIEQPQRVLVVGLGGGTIPTFLRKHFPELRIEAVDIDPGVVEVAKTHFGFREDARMRAYVEDGRKFIEQRQNLYNIIYLDAFGPDSIPYTLTTREFLTSVRRALTPQGVVIGNIWSRYSNPLYDSMVRTYQTVFEEVFIVDIAGVGNKIVVACPRKRQLPIGDLMRRCHVLTRELELRTNLAELIQSGFRVPGEDGVDGRVLTDAAPPKENR